MADDQTIPWQRIPEEPNGQPPFDGEDYLLYADSATVDVVRLGRWEEGRTNPCNDDEIWERGWWSARHSVTTEHLDFLEFTHWAPFNAPAEVEAMYEEMYR